MFHFVLHADICKFAGAQSEEALGQNLFAEIGRDLFIAFARCIAELPLRIVEHVVCFQ